MPFIVKSMLKILINPPTIIQGTPENPDFSGLPSDVISLLQEAIDKGEYEVIPDPEPSPEPPNLTGLRDEISYGNRYPLVQNWYDGLLPRQRDPLQVAIANQNLSDIEHCLRPILPTDEATLAELGALLIEFNVPINL